MAKEVTNYFDQCISRWLEAEKEKDAAFAKKVDESGKNVEGCCNYILQQVKASKQCGFADEEIYGMARHYFDEDDVKDPGAQGNCRVVVSGHVDLSERAFLRGLPTLFPKPSKKCYEAFLQEIHREALISQ